MGRGPVGAPAIIRYNNQSISAIDDVSGLSDSMVLIKTVTASSSATISFVDGTSDVVLDNTYPIYKFVLIDIHPSANTTDLTFQASTDTGSSYGVTATSTCFTSQLDEANTAPGLSYSGDPRHLAQSSSFQSLSIDCGNDNDQSAAGELWLYNPSSTTFVKHFLSRVQNYHGSDYSIEAYAAGYFNTTSAVDAIQFKFDSGNIDAGTFKLYGIKDS